MEGLIRWKSSHTNTVISPVEFIPLAEENGTIIDIGWFVIEEALKLLKEHDSGSWFISVNVSPLQFIELDFSKKLDKMINQYQIDKSRLKLEITETSTGVGAEFFWQILDELISKNYRLALDDFGTGESSLFRLYNVAFDTLKIDRSFLKDITRETRSLDIYKSILQLGKIMNNTIIAEGIETEEEHLILKEIGVAFTQGFFYSRPVPFEKVMSQFGL
ncbi:MAG: EAL domain-containing protein [Spirochaetales bacterium]|nr:EAL domain-containing protein [Spirochaetales bacterium]